MTVSTHVYTAVIAGTPTRPLELLGGQITLSDQRSPHVTASISVAMPSLETLTYLDPRDGARVIITAQFTPTTGPGVTRTFNLGVRDYEVDQAGALVRVSLASDEALLEDYAPLALDESPREYETSLRGVVNYVLAKIGATLQPGTEDADVTRTWALTNLVMNPAADTTTGYTLGTNASTLSVGNSSPYQGTGYIRWVAVTAGVASFLNVGISDTRVNAGDRMTFNAYVRASAAGLTGRLYVQYRDSAGAVVGDGALSPITTLATGTGWSELSLTLTVPEGIVAAQPYVVGYGPAGSVFAADACSYYADHEFVDWFSGSSGNPGYATAWSGAANNSPSTRTPLVERPREALQWQAGQSAMDFLAPLVQSLGLRLVCDEARRWTLRDEEHTAPGSLAIRYGVNMIEGSERISRDAGLWFDARTTIYRYRDAAGVEQIREDSYALALPYTKHTVLELEAPYPGPGRSAYAVRRAQSRGREVAATAVADWRAAAEQPVTIALASAPIQTGRTSEVRFDLDTDRMAITARTTDTPPLAWVLGPSDLTWNAADPGLTWDEITEWSDI